MSRLSGCYRSNTGEVFTLTQEQTPISYSFCSLFFGEINAMVKLHLDSLVSLGGVRICIGLSRQNREMLEPVLNDRNIETCLHYVDESPQAALIFERFDLNTNSSYAYTHEHFAVVNLFKWIFLLDVYNKHKELTHFVFTDFDVLWLSKPSREDFLAISGLSGISTQLDSLSQGRNVHCTGIIFLQNTLRAKSFLQNVLNRQMQQVLAGNLRYYDQVAFNDLVDLQSRPNLFGFLSTESYVIGSDALKLSLSNLRHIRKNVVAFHANYIIGHESKYLMMSSLLGTYRGSFRSRLIFFQRALWCTMERAGQIFSQSVKSKLKIV